MRELSLALSRIVSTNKDHLVTLRDDSDITAVELAALHHEVAVDPMRLSPGVNGALKHVSCFLAVNEILMLEVTSQSLSKTVCNPLLIPS